MVSIGWDQVVARRLERSSLAARTRADRLTDVVRDLCGLQAQLQASAELQLAARIDGLARADIRQALWERRELVKAWTIRGTLHVHPAPELALWHAARRAVAPPDEDGLAPWRDPNGVVHPALGRAEVEAIRDAVWDVLDGRCLLRDQLAGEVVERVGPAGRTRLLSGFAFFLGELCQGPPQGSKVSFVRPDQWIDGWAPVDEHDALREVCKRYLRTYGPARPADFSEWFASTAFGVTHARELFDSLVSELEEVDVDGRRSFVLAGDTTFPEPGTSVRLLPEYDVYVMGSRERDLLVPDDVRALVAAHRRGRYEGPAGVRFLAVDGIAAGLWERTRRGKEVDVTVEPAHKLARAYRAELDREVARITAFLAT